MFSVLDFSSSSRIELFCHLQLKAIVHFLFEILHFILKKTKFMFSIIEKDTFSAFLI